MGDLNDIIERLKKNKYNRQSFLSIWHPEDQSNDKENKRIPCTLGYFFQYRNNKLNVSANVTRHNKVYCLTRKQDRSPNSGLVEFDTYSSMQIKIVLLAEQSHIVPKVEQVQVIGVSA